MTKATLIKKATDDELFEFEDAVPLGRVYDVDAQHPTVMQFFNVEKGVKHAKVMVRDLDRPGWLPLECLAVEV